MDLDTMPGIEGAARVAGPAPLARGAAPEPAGRRSEVFGVLVSGLASPHGETAGARASRPMTSGPGAEEPPATEASVRREPTRTEGPEPPSPRPRARRETAGGATHQPPPSVAAPPEERPQPDSPPAIAAKDESAPDGPTGAPGPGQDVRMAGTTTGESPASPGPVDAAGAAPTGLVATPLSAAAVPAGGTEPGTTAGADGAPVPGASARRGTAMPAAIIAARAESVPETPPTVAVTTADGPGVEGTGRPGSEPPPAPDAGWPSAGVPAAHTHGEPEAQRGEAAPAGAGRTNPLASLPAPWGDPTEAVEAPRPDPARAAATAMLASALASASPGADVSGSEKAETVGAQAGAEPPAARPTSILAEPRARVAGDRPWTSAGRVGGPAAVEGAVRAVGTPADTGGEGHEPIPGRSSAPATALPPGLMALEPDDRGAAFARRGAESSSSTERPDVESPSLPPVASLVPNGGARGEAWPRSREDRPVVPPALAPAWLAGPAGVTYQLRTEAGGIAEAAAPPRPAPADIGPPAGAPHEQIVRAIRLQWIQGIGEAHLRLSPAHLGEVTIRLRVEHGIVTASLRGESAAAIERIRAHEADLRAALKEQGLTLDGLELAIDPDARRRGRHPAKRVFEPAPRRRANATGSTFEVTA